MISALSPVIDIARVYADALWLRFKLAVKSNETLEQAMDLASALASRTSGRDSTAAVATIITETFGRAFAADETDPDMEVDDGVVRARPVRWRGWAVPFRCRWFSV